MIKDLSLDSIIIATNQKKKTVDVRDGALLWWAFVVLNKKMHGEHISK